MEINEFTQNLESMQKADPVKFKQMMALMKAIGSPPEPLMNLLERLEIPWERRGDELVIKWKDFLAGEQLNQAQGPILKRLVEDQNPNAQSIMDLFGDGK